MSVVEDELERLDSDPPDRPTLPKRVLIVAQSRGLGGMETHLMELSIELARRGTAVRLVMPVAVEYDDLAAAASAAGVKAWRLNTVSVRGRPAQAYGLAMLAWRLVRWRPEVVHIHTGSAVGGLAVVLLVRLLTPATLVLSEHQVPLPVPSLHQRFTRAIADRAVHALVAVSRSNAALRARNLGVGTRHFAAVLNGVPVIDLDAPARAADRRRVRAGFDIAGDEVVIGCVARLAEDKGLPVLLRAFALLPSQPRCHLLLVGEGPIRSELEALATALGVADRVFFAGNQPRPIPYLHAMDVFALAVPAGSMSIALLEAMSRGLPAVITFCGPEEAVIPGQTGLGAPPNDPAALAEALRRLVCDERLRGELGTAAAAHVRRYYSSERVADDLLEVYAVRRTGRLPDRLQAGARPALSPVTSNGNDRSSGRPLAARNR